MAVVSPGAILTDAVETENLELSLDIDAVNSDPPSLVIAKLALLEPVINVDPKSISSVDKDAIGYVGGSAILTSSMCGLLVPYTLVPTNLTKLLGQHKQINHKTAPPNQLLMLVW